jgi:hypothetical protein
MKELFSLEAPRAEDEILSFCTLLYWLFCGWQIFDSAVQDYFAGYWVRDFIFSNLALCVCG